MSNQKYLKNVVKLELDVDKCTGCGLCDIVCPHTVFEVKDGKAKIIDRDSCMECGACALNCPVKAITASCGAGCATAVINKALGKNGADCCCC